MQSLPPYSNRRNAAEKQRRLLVAPHVDAPSQFVFLLDAEGHGQKPLDDFGIRGRVQGRLAGP